ncbi:MAG: glycosyltransferase [Planctomycetota bacterium]
MRLWRQFGIDVTFIPTWKPTETWQARLEGIGCRTVQTSPDDLDDVAGLRGSTVVSFCNTNFLRQAQRFRALGCKIIWVGCMNWLFSEERRHYRRHGPFDRYVFQSAYQQSELAPQLARFGVKPDECHRIRGAFFWDEFPFQPLRHEPKTPFVLGRLSRAARDKYSKNTWAIYGRVPHPVKARLMAWNAQVENKLGKPPAWAECLPAGAETSRQFLGTLHCMVPINGGAGENWPRCALEAMAGGVPIVAENKWGWREMIRHGQTGYLASTDDETAYYAARLAYDEDHRLQIVHPARQALQDELAHPEETWAGWQRLFEEMGS